MITPSEFGSWKEFFSFGLAREYQRLDNGQLFEVQSGRLETVGRTLSVIVIKPLDALARGIRNPLVILSLTMVSLFFVSIAFYPLQTWGVVSTVLPFVKSITAAEIQVSYYTISQATILGLGLQAFGRFNNPALMQAHRDRAIRPIPIGAVRNV